MAYTPNTPWVDGSGGGTPITAARLNNMEAGLSYVLGYTELTSDFAITATTEATANTIVTAPAVTFNGSTVCWVEFGCTSWFHSATEGRLNLWLYDGAASIGRIGWVTAPFTANLPAMPIAVRRKLTPSAAAHTFSLRGSTAAGTATIYAGAGGITALMPGYIRIVRDV